MFVYCANKNLICLIYDACHNRASLQIGYERFETRRLASAADVVSRCSTPFNTCIYMFVEYKLHNFVLCNKQVMRLVCVSVCAAAHLDTITSDSRTYRIESG